VNEKDVRESLYVDRKTGRMALNGQSVASVCLSVWLIGVCWCRECWSTVWEGKGDYMLWYHWRA
jgi:hypothetical protein